MAERSQFFDTTGTGDGSGSGYTEENLRQQHSRMMTTTLTTEGVLYGVGNNLAVSGTTSPVSINTGAAFVYGYYYENDSSVSQAISTPTTATRVDVIVLRVSWAAQTVRITRVAGTEGAGVPSITQTANTTWDIPLANVSITTGGAITLTDRRTYCKSPAAYGWFASALALTGNLSVTGTITSTSSITATTNVTGAIINTDANNYWFITGGNPTYYHDATDYDNFDRASNIRSIYIGGSQVLRIDGSGNTVVSGTLTPGALGGTGVVGATQLASNAVTTAKITDANVTTAKIATDAVDDTIVGNRVAKLYRRQGGSATDWSSAGTTTQTPGMIVEQAGVINKSFTSATLVSQTVTFPVAFSQTPLVTFSLGPTQSFSGGGNVSYVSYGSVSTTGFTVNISFTAANTGNLDITWRAIGTE